MHVRLTTVTLAELPALVALHNMVSADLTSRFGQGPWSGQVTERGILFGMRTSVIYIARSSQQIIATLRLSTRKPSSINKKFFSPTSQKPLYLTGMAVHLSSNGRASAAVAWKKRSGSPDSGPPMPFALTLGMPRRCRRVLPQVWLPGSGPRHSP